MNTPRPIDCDHARLLDELVDRATKLLQRLGSTYYDGFDNSHHTYITIGDYDFYYDSVAGLSIRTGRSPSRTIFHRGVTGFTTKNAAGHSSQIVKTLRRAMVLDDLANV